MQDTVMAKALLMVDYQCVRLFGATYGVGFPNWSTAALAVITALDEQVTNCAKAHVICDRERQEALEKITALEKLHGQKT